MNDWQIRINIPEEEKDIVRAFAQGEANRLGRNVFLMREDQGEMVFVEILYPEPKR